jgi:stage III sporulation protein AA
MLLLRAMNPQIIAMDEITAPEDIAAITAAANCGVELIATAHGSGTDDLSRRGLYRKLMDTEVFSRAVVICRRGGERKYTVLCREGEKWLDLQER